MNSDSNYSAIKKAIDELTEILDRSQPSNKEASNLLRRMDSTIIDLENRFASAFAGQALVTSSLLTK
jgi:hypothetical protein